MLTKKHFQQLARIAGTIESPEARAAVAIQLAIMAEDENPRFNAKRFHEAVEDEAENHRRAQDVARK